jgi:UDP-glucose 4-epimerase
MGLKKAIVTGATGPLGVALAGYLAERNYLVTAVVRPGSKRINDLPVSDRISVIECDLSALSCLTKLLSHGYDTFFHLGWCATEDREARNDPSIHAHNILYTLDAAKLSHTLGCLTFIGAGSQSELIRTDNTPAAEHTGPREESYGIAKYAAGRLSLRLCEQNGIRHCWARIMSIYGPVERETTALMYCIYSLLRGEKPSLTRGEQTWDYMYSADCARALHLLADKGRHGRAYNVGSGSTRPLREYFERTRDCIDPSLPLGLGEKEYVPGQIMHTCSDISLLTEDTGFVPEYSFTRGIIETIEWARKRAGITVKSLDGVRVSTRRVTGGDTRSIDSLEEKPRNA